MEEHVRKAVINHMWEETLGNILKQDVPNEEINEDTPFEFKDPGNSTEVEMEITFAPLNLSNFPGRLDELPEIFWHAFKGNHDNAVHHVEWFMTLASEYGIKKEEDIYTRSFLLHLGGKALAWFVDLDKGTMSSFAKLVETFCSYWDLGRRNK